MVRVPADFPHWISLGWSPIIQLPASEKPKSSRARSRNHGEGLRQTHNPEYPGSTPFGWCRQ
jgi:hypothetical protein